MSSVFTKYVIALESEAEPEGAYETVAELRSLLAREIRRRGMWQLPPTYLGVIGWRSWSERGERSGEGPLDDLLADCYEFVFVRRLRGLAAHARSSGNIDGIVVLALRNFLHDTQRRHDPLGYQIFELLRQACRNLVAAGTLRRIRGPKAIGNGTVLGFGRSEEAAPAERLGEASASWAGSLLPGLVTAPSSSQIPLLERRVEALLEHGIAAFGFRDLAEPLKNRVRGHWAAALGHEQGETALEEGPDGELLIVHLTPPDRGLEARDSFEKMLLGVEAGIDELELSPRTRQQVETLWEYLRAHAAERSNLGSADDSLPSRRALSRLLGVPRDRFPRLFHILAEVLSRYRETSNSEKGPL